MQFGGQLECGVHDEVGLRSGFIGRQFVGQGVGRSQLFNKLLYDALVQVLVREVFQHATGGSTHQRAAAVPELFQESVPVVLELIHPVCTGSFHLLACFVH